MKIKRNNNFILGAGITGLAAGYKTGWPIFEAKSFPGGLCASYYIRPGSGKRLSQNPKDEEVYRFHFGGGHWIFGAKKEILGFIKKFAPMKSYSRRSSVFFPKENLYIPYPLQNNLRYFTKATARKIISEMSNSSDVPPVTEKVWLLRNFGKILCERFFWPFNEAYTAGLYDKISPQDVYKTPLDHKLIREGAKRKTRPAGYNATFLYPRKELGYFINRIAECCRICYEKRIERINIKKKKIYFSDRSSIGYENIISSLPLNKMMEMIDLKVAAKPDPHTSVLVLNIGAVRGERCPDEHWLYIPQSSSGFHRVGFYSNVDNLFLPKSTRKACNRVSIYIERSYCEKEKPSEQDIKEYTDSVVAELQKWGFIKNAEVIDPNWIDTAYTWTWPDSKWREQALGLLKEGGIHSIGRYGGWKFQGIAESLNNGLSLSSKF